MTVFRTAYQRGADAIAIMIDLLRARTNNRAARHASHRQARRLKPPRDLPDYGVHRKFRQ